MAASLAALVTLFAQATYADDCGRPNLVATFPIDGASAVPLNAKLSASYAESADYLGEAVTLASETGDRTLDARFDASERRLIVDEPALEPNTHYTLAWPALRGISTAGHGSTKTISFTTGDALDAAAPDFQGITKLAWDLVHPRDECTDDLEPRMRFSFGLGEARDDGGAESLELLLFQTSPGSADAPRFVASRAFPHDLRTNLDLTVADATGNICFAALVRDLVGNASATGSVTRCIRTTAPPIFYGCSMSARPARPESLGGLALALVAILARRRAGQR
ncbi:MAG TPA: hypothetical protein VFQ35_09285 [Polyangiaceae bacterium]|nr:hypothetical protein [Polyangiaceae bacterium]